MGHNLHYTIVKQSLSTSKEYVCEYVWKKKEGGNFELLIPRLVTVQGRSVIRCTMCMDPNEVSQPKRAS